MVSFLGGLRAGEIASLKLNHAINDGGRIAVVNTEGNVQNLLRVTRIDRLFPICHDVPSALATIERAG